MVRLGATFPGHTHVDGNAIVPAVCVTCSRHVVPTAGALENENVVFAETVACHLAFVPHAIAVPESVPGAGGEVGIVMFAVPSNAMPLIVRAVWSLVAVAALNVDPL